MAFLFASDGCAMMNHKIKTAINLITGINYVCNFTFTRISLIIINAIEKNQFGGSHEQGINYDNIDIDSFSRCYFIRAKSKRSGHKTDERK
jgi:hypothetical protein